MILTGAALPSASIASLAQFPGMPHLSPKLLQKILSRDLADLLLEQIHCSASTSPSASLVVLPESSYVTHRHKKRQIYTRHSYMAWVQEYSTYMLALASSFPELLLELIAYQLLIVQHRHKFEYPSRLRYDIEFQQWSAHKWSHIHPQFYAFAFTAHGKTTDSLDQCNCLKKVSYLFFHQYYLYSYNETFP